MSKYLFIAIFILLVFSVPLVSAKTYEVVAVGAIHSEDDTVYVTPVYATDVLQDTANGILSFKVVQHPLSYDQLLGASQNASDASTPINKLPTITTLHEGDTVQIDFKDCEYSEKSVTQDPLTQNYLIIYAGQANSVTINATEIIPELPTIMAMTTLVLFTLTVLLLRRRKNEKKRITYSV